MKGHPAAAVLFDLDGTLLDTLEDLMNSGNEVLREEGHPEHDRDAYRHFVGGGMDHLMRCIFPESARPETEEQMAAVLSRYRAAYERNWRATTRPYEGIPGLLDELEARGIAKAVLSNKAHDFTERCVAEFLPGWRWDVVLGHREGTEKKPDPASALEAAARLGVAPGDCWFLGDTEVDIETARRAGMVSVGVTWGFRDLAVLEAAGPDFIIHHPGDLWHLTGFAG